MKWVIIDVELIENFSKLCELFSKNSTIFGDWDISTFSIEITEKKVFMYIS